MLTFENVCRARTALTFSLRAENIFCHEPQQLLCVLSAKKKEKKKKKKTSSVMNHSSFFAS